jgi:hypothetical protein
LSATASTAARSCPVSTSPFSPMGGFDFQTRDAMRCFVFSYTGKKKRARRLC